MKKQSLSSRGVLVNVLAILFLLGSGVAAFCQINGDVNNSNAVDINDALVIARYSAGMSVTINLALADTNCDTAVNINDALVVARYTAGLATICPISATPTPTPTPTRTPTQTPTRTPTPTPTPTPTNYSGYVYLGFDDGPVSNSPTLVNNLKSAGAKATMFVWGNRISSNATGWNAYLNSGFSLQNHSWTHSHMTSWGYQQIYDDLNQCQQAIQNAGKPKPTKIRLPYLESNSTIQQACSALGLSVVNTTVDTQDWNGASTSAIVSACNNLQANGCPLMHDGYSTTNGAISQIVQNLKNRGLGTSQY